MATWSNNNLAHADTYLTLRVLEQTRRKFANAGSLKIQGLAFFDPGAAQATIAEKARSLAVQMDNVFRVFFQAKYEPSVNKARTLTRLSTVLADGEKTVQNLADAADDCYRLHGEPNVA